MKLTNTGNKRTLIQPNVTNNQKPQRGILNRLHHGTKTSYTDNRRPLNKFHHQEYKAPQSNNEKSHAVSLGGETKSP